ELQEDLEQHLSHGVLKHAREPSVRERAAKWMRRHPTASSTSSIFLMAVALLALVGSASWLAIRDARAARARVQYLEFHQAFEQCRFLLNATHHGPSDPLLQGIRLARQALRPYLLGRPADLASTPMVRDLPRAERAAFESEATEL